MGIFSLLSAGGLFSLARPAGARTVVGGGACTPRRKCSGRAPWRVLWAFKVAKSGKVNRGEASRRARAELQPSRTMDGSPDGQRGQQQVFRVFCALFVYVRVTAGTPPGRLTTSQLEGGRLATSHPGPSRMQQQQQSRFELLSSCRGAFVRVVFEDDTWEYVTNSGGICSASGKYVVGPSIEGFSVDLGTPQFGSQLPPRATSHTVSASQQQDIAVAAVDHPEHSL